MRRISVLIFAVFICLFLVVPAYAEDDFSLSINPSIIIINANPPANTESQFTVQNKTSKSVSLNIQIKTFKGMGENGRIEFTQDNPEILQRIRILDGDREINNLDLDPYQSKNLKLTAEINGLDPQSDYYLSLLFVSRTSQSSDSSTNFVGGIGTNVILSISRSAKASGNINQFSTPLISFGGSIPFTIKIENTGQNYIEPRGRISVYDMFGRDKGFIEILPQIILSHSKRYLIDTSQKDEAFSAKMKQDHPVMLWTQNFLFGFYTANLLVKLAPNGPQFERSINFVSIPLYLIIVLSLFISILLGIYIKIKKKI